jgi:hypothetical protein
LKPCYTEKLISFAFDKFLPERQSILFKNIGASAVLTYTAMANPLNPFYDGIDYGRGLVDGYQSTIGVFGVHESILDPFIDGIGDFTREQISTSQ